MIEPHVLAGLMFREAARRWFESHQRHISPNTRRHYETCIVALGKFFAQLPLREIHIGHFEQYQAMRKEGSGGLQAAGPSRTNHELNTLSQILHRAGLWAPIRVYYKPLPMPRPKVGRALSEDEERRLFVAANSHSKWKVAYWCSLLTVNTTAGPGEIRLLHLRDLHLNTCEASPIATITVVEGAKNDYRVRTLPLNATARWAAANLLERAHRIGAVEPHHYLLPHRARVKGPVTFDPLRPMSGWKKAWDSMRKAAGMPDLRMYDLRHHSITRLLEDETISERTVMELAGHVSKRMLDRYSHIRLNTLHQAVENLERKPPRPTPSLVREPESAFHR